MTLIASLLFAIALLASVGVIALTVGNAMSRIMEVIELEFEPVLQSERRIIFGELKTTKRASQAEIIAFPRSSLIPVDFRLAA